jgi:hypothetical protein
MVGSTHTFRLNANGPPRIYQTGEDLLNVTPLGTKISAIRFLISSTPFLTPDQLFLEGLNRVHDTCRSAMVFLSNPTNLQQRQDLFTKAGSIPICSVLDTQILAMGYRLFDTHPFRLAGWSNDQLSPSNIAYAWKSAQLVFDASWQTNSANPTQAHATLPPGLPSPLDTAVSGQSASVSVAYSTTNSQESASATSAQTLVSSVSAVSVATQSKPSSLKKSSPLKTLTKISIPKQASAPVT